MADTAEIKTLVERKHEIYSAREYQNYINVLGWKGGKPYINERLSRFAAESNIDWEGGTRSDGSAVTGRKDQAYTVPHLGRIVDKINQYVFATVPKRTNIPTDLELDITSKGKSLNDLMEEVSSLITVNGWCWIGLDAPQSPDVQLSVADKSALKYRPYAQVYEASQVVDWYINSSGVIEWLITETQEYIAKNHSVPSQSVLVRKLWTPGRVTTLIIQEGKEDTIIENTDLSFTDSVPFVLVGIPDADPHIFDSLESINRTILDLSSANFSNYYQTVYPQMFLPASVLDTVMSTYNVTAETATTMIKGFSYPILLAENDAQPGYIMPDAGSIESMRLELTALKNELYESTGLLLRKESRAAESAESKGYDYLDLAMLVRARAGILEDAENKVAKLIHGWDNSIPVYVVEYNKTTQIAEDSVKDEIKSAVGLNDPA